jgi:adenylate kinase
MIALFFGAPGVGKGTQAALFAEREGIPYLSTGEAFRAAIAAQTEVGKLAQEYVDSGGLVPDDVVTRIVEETLAVPKFANGAILDGFPRTLAQATALDTILAARGTKVTLVVNIVVDREEIVQRLLARGRKDDKEDIIRHRFAVYEQETAPLLEYYKAVVQTIDGNADVETVYARVKAALSTSQHVV